MKPYRSMCMCVFFLLILPGGLLFSQQQINWEAWDASGAGHSLSGTVKVYSSFGQPAVGASISNNHFINSGYLQNTSDVLRPPDLQLSTLTLNFGSVPVLTSKELELEVHNIGMSNLEISRQIIVGADSLHFSIQQTAPSSIAASGQATMRIRHLPLTGGSKTAILRLHSNDPDLPVAEVVLSSMVTDVKRLPQHPASIRLHQNYPNPFNPTTTLEYEIDEACKISLTVYDVHGRTVSVLDRSWREAGVYRVEFDAAYCPSGAYIAVLEAIRPSGVRTERVRMILAK